MTREPGRAFRLPWRTPASIRSDFEEELALHLELRVAELVTAGRSPEEARAIALTEFGDVEDARRYVNALDGTTEAAWRRREMVTELTRDILHAARRLRRAPLFTLTSALTLALGIGACTLMLSLVRGILLSPPPFRDPDRVLMVWADYSQAGLVGEQPLFGRQFATLRDEARAFASVGAFRTRSYNLGARASTERLDGQEVTSGFFESVGVEPQLGRFFTRADETPGGARVVVLSDGLWRRRFGADLELIGSSIELNGEPYTVIGVAARGFAFPRGAEMPKNFQFPVSSELWVPIAPPAGGPSDLVGVARLAPGITVEAAIEDLKRVTTILEGLIPQGKGSMGMFVVPLRAQLTGGVATMLLSLLGAVVLVLAVACVNTAQLFLAQLQVRRLDLAVRAALGASYRRLTTELVAEAALLAGVAGAIGTALGAAGLTLVRAYGSGRIPRLAEVTFDGGSAAAAVLVTLFVAVCASALPAAVGSRVPLADVLRQGGRGTGSRGMLRDARRLLIIAEVALSVVLVAAAGLLIRSLSQQLGSDTGFSAPNGVTFEVTLPPTRYAERQFRTYMEHPAAVPFFNDALTRIRAIPGVRAAAIAKPLPLSGAQEASVFTAEGIDAGRAFGSAEEAVTPFAEYTLASSQMFRALGTPLLAGRDFSDSDRQETLPVVIVNQAMARRLWPGQSAVGKRIRLGGPNTTEAWWMTVIGVAADIKRYSLTEEPRPEMIVPFTQRPYPSFATMQFVVRSTLAPALLLPAVRQAIAAADPGVPVSKFGTIDDLIVETSASARFATRFMTAFGVAALLLAMIGLYGVIAYSVHQRRREFGVRRALGASSARIIAVVMGEGLKLVAVGVTIGVLGALLASRVLQHLLYEISAFDPLTFGGAVVLLAAAATLACLIPASQASRVEPRVALEE